MFESIKNKFRKRYIPERERNFSLKDRVSELEKTVERLENASYVPLITGSGFFDGYIYEEINKVVLKFIKEMGYEITYKEDVKGGACIKKKPSKKLKNT